MKTDNNLEKKNNKNEMNYLDSSRHKMAFKKELNIYEMTSQSVNKKFKNKKNKTRINEWVKMCKLRKSA